MPEIVRVTRPRAQADWPEMAPIASTGDAHLRVNGAVDKTTEIKISFGHQLCASTIGPGHRLKRAAS